MGRIVSNLIAGDGRNYVNVADAIAQNSLNWEVTKRPLFVRIPTGFKEDGVTPEGVFRRADNLFGIVRADNRATLGVVKSTYKTIQNFEGFESLDTLVSEGGLRLIGAGDMNGGAQVWMQAQAPKMLKIGGEDIASSILAMMSHDGTGSLRYLPSFVRFFCTNQLRGLLRAAKKVTQEWARPIRHSQTATSRIMVARESLRQLVAAQTAFVELGESLLARSFSASDMRKLADVLLPKPQGEEATNRAMTMWTQRMDSLMRDAYLAPDLNSIRNTPWGALNAVADYEQHHMRMTGDENARMEKLFLRSFQDGPLVRQTVAILTA